MKLFQKAFGTAEHFFDKSVLDRNHAIRDSALSHRSTAGKRGYSTTIGRAAVLLLTGEAKIRHDPARRIIQVAFDTKSAGRVTCTSQHLLNSTGHNRLTPRKWAFNSEHPLGEPMLMIAEALLLEDHWPDTLAALQHAADLSGYPIAPADLKQLPNTNDDFITAMHRISDHMYYEGKATEDAISDVLPSSINTVESDLNTVTTSTIREKLKVALAARTQTVSKDSTLGRLMRLTKRGGVALLIGPPATFKTETVKRLVLETGAQVVKMRGAPGVEDNDHIGEIVPGEQGPVWVDGPLTRAFVLAARGQTILHIDEILRYQPETLNILITALDELSYEDAKAVLAPSLKQLPDDAQRRALLDEHLPHQDTRYYMLALRNGDLLFAPKKNLSWVMTTNMGEDHLQTADRIDSALLSRISLVIDIARAGAEITHPIYRAVVGEDEHTDVLVKIASEFEDMTYNEYAQGESLLCRPLDPRKVIALLEEARGCLSDGMDVAAALQEAALVTAVPHCSPRQADGSLEPGATTRIMAMLAEVISASSVFTTPARRIGK